MKNNKILQILFLIIVTVVSFFFGTRVGYNVAQKRIDTQYVVAYKDNVITDVKAKLLVLKSLRNNDCIKATNALEDFLDVNLASLSNYENGNKVSDNEIEKVVRSAKLYRNEYNDHKINPRLEKSVKNLFDKYNK